MAEHGVELVQRIDPTAQHRLVDRQCRRHFGNLLVRLRQNSCRGGSSRRMVTGRPCMISKSSAKSERCMGSSLASEARRPASCPRQDHLAHHITWLPSKVDVLGAAKADTLGRRHARTCIGHVSVLVRTFMRRVRSAHSMMRSKSPDSSGWLRGLRPQHPGLEEPSMVMTSPSSASRPM